MALPPFLGRTVLSAPATSAAGGTGTEIVCENQLPGTPQSQCDIDGSKDDSMQGLATSMNVNRGQAIGVTIKPDAYAVSSTIHRNTATRGSDIKWWTSLEWVSACGAPR